MRALEEINLKITKMEGMKSEADEKFIKLQEENAAKFIDFD
jgi:hypothetical protein